MISFGVCMTCLRSLPLFFFVHVIALSSLFSIGFRLAEPDRILALDLFSINLDSCNDAHNLAFENPFENP